MANSPWTIIKSRYSHTNKWFKVKKYDVITPDGSEGEYNVIEIPPSVAIVAMNDRQEICLTEEYRFPHQKWMWQIPVGREDKGDKTILAAAKRELEEETGLIASSWTFAGRTNGLKGLTNQVLDTFIAKDLKNLEALRPEWTEGIRSARFVAIDDLLREIRDGKISDNETISSITLALIKLHII